MPSFDSGPGRDPIDPAFAGLFRPDEDPPAPVDDDEPHFEPIVDPVVDPRAEPADQPPLIPTANPIADTGRLFRSQGVVDHDEAVLALASAHAGRLRTLVRLDESVPSAAGPDIEAASVVAEEEQVLDVAGTDPADATAVGRRARRRKGAQRGHRARGITGGAVYLIVIGVTVLVAFANVLISDGAIGWPTGLALVIASVYAALTVRREDDAVAIIVPPVAFLVAALTAGQLFIGSAEGSLLNRAVVAFFTLADNWIWIIGATAAALVIVLVRRRRG